MLFSEVVGQHDIKQKLIDSVQRDRISHAQLLLGPLGRGGLPLALAFSQYINCENPLDTDSCGECSSCKKLEKLAHPDVHYSYPFPSVDKKKLATESITQWREALAANPYQNLNDWMLVFDAENKQANITKDECQDIQKKLSFKTFESKYKVLIMWLPEFLGKEGNRLLKLIEEPPENTLFIFVAEDADKILPTILSRTQITKVNPIAQESLVGELIRLKGIDKDRAKAITQFADGNFREAQQMIEESTNSNLDLLSNWLKICSQRNLPNAALAVMDEFGGLGREAQKRFIQYALHFFNQSLYLQLGKPVNLSEAEMSTAQAVSNYLTLDTIQDIYKRLNKAYYHLERNANGKMLMLSLSININKLLNGISVVDENIYSSANR